MVFQSRYNVLPRVIPLDLQDTIVKDGYQLPNLSLLLTKSLQATALKKMREHAVIRHKKLDETNRIEKLLISYLSPRSQSTLIDSENCHYSYSQAELTIEQHSNPIPNVDSSSKPLVVKEDGQSYQKMLTNGYISRYPNRFFGCLSCGASSHQFKECKDNRVNTARSLYWQELWDHAPKTRKRISPPFNPKPFTNTVTITAVSESPVSNTTNIPVTSSLNQNSVVDGHPTRHRLGRDNQINRLFWQNSKKTASILRNMRYCF